MTPTQRNNRLTLIRQIAQHAARRRQLALLLENFDRHAELEGSPLRAAGREEVPRGGDRAEIQDMVESQH